METVAGFGNAKQRLLELENTQRIEDAEALETTEAEQRLALFHSFRSVKFEWSDLDGMRYVRRRYNSTDPTADARTRTRRRAPAAAPQLQQTASFAVLTNASLAAFSADDTICVRGCPPPPPPPIPMATAKQEGVVARQEALRRRLRLVPRVPYIRICVCVCGGRPDPRPRLPFAAVTAGDEDEDDDDGDAWVDEDELDGDEGENPDVGDGTFDESALPTPVPGMWRFSSLPRPADAPSPAFPPTPPALGIEIPRSPGTPAPLYEVEFPLTPAPLSPTASTYSLEGEHVGGKRKR
ncbi:hypothetical protein FB451DRAFT_1549600 [Mycena latifolia]|nr:hypothetical protein FB451DRAFT_1549600 [Mycena latifolia]